MNRRNTIIYWTSTILLALGMLSGGLAQLFRVKESVDGIVHIGYPAYFVSLLGMWKIAGVIVLLSPRLPLLKEWAYAGFFFAMTGAVISHLAAGNHFTEFLAPLVFTLLIVISWYYRPAHKKLVPAT